jgi:hypothetical protein
VIEWGRTDVVRQRLGAATRDVRFERGSFYIPALGPRHFLAWQESRLGPMKGLASALASEPAKLAAERAEFLAAIEPYFDGNEARHDYLLTRAVKA